jgi:hypothetical protein
LFAAALVAYALMFLFGSGSPIPIIGVGIIWLGGAAVAFRIASSETTSIPTYEPGVSGLLMRQEPLVPLPLHDAIQMSRRYGAVQGGVRIQQLHSGYSVSQLPYLFSDDHPSLSSAESAAQQVIANYDPTGWKSM